MNEHVEFLKTTFEDKFWKIKNKKIGIYGTGNNSKVIISNIKGFNFECVIDENYQEVSFCGLPVKKISDALNSIEILMIASIPISTKKIYNRIKSKLTDSVLVFDLRGHNLSSNLCSKDIIRSNITNSYDLYVAEQFISKLNFENDRLFINDYKTIAYLIAPITSLYICYINKMSKRYDNVLFSSRDGYFLYHIFKKYNLMGKTKVDYFYTSRSAISSASITTEEDIRVLCNKLYEDKKTNILSFIKTQFHIDIPLELDMSVEKAIHLNGKEYIKNTLEKFYSQIIQKSSELRKNYLLYIDKLELKNKIAVVDIVTQGTIVFGLSKLVNKNVDLISLGTTAVPNDYLNSWFKVNSMLGNINDKVDGIPFSFSDFSELHLILEILYASSEGQLVEFNYLGKPVFLEKSKYDYNLISSVQFELEKIIMSDIGKIFQKCSVKFAKKILMLFYSRFAMYDEKIKMEFLFDDPYDTRMNKINLIDCLGW